MADIFADAAAWLGDQMATHAAGSIEYHRGGRVVGPIAATKGETIRDDLVVDGLETQRQPARLVDFIVRAADLVLDAEAFDPRPGDLIVADCVRYRVAQPISGEPPFSYTTPHRNQFRIHTVVVK